MQETLCLFTSCLVPPDVSHAIGMLQKIFQIVWNTRLSPAVPYVRLILTELMNLYRRRRAATCLLSGCCSKNSRNFCGYSHVLTVFVRAIIILPTSLILQVTGLKAKSHSAGRIILKSMEVFSSRYFLQGGKMFGHTPAAEHRSHS
jgi:hypothetical protein